MSHIGRSRILILATLAGAALAVLPSQICQAAYPEQLIKIIVTFPPGGSADIVIRALEPVVAADPRELQLSGKKYTASGEIPVFAERSILAAQRKLSLPPPQIRSIGQRVGRPRQNQQALLVV